MSTSSSNEKNATQKPPPLETLGVKVPPAMKDALWKMAESAGVPPAKFIRQQLRRVVETGQGAPSPAEPAAAAPVAPAPAPLQQELDPTIVALLEGIAMTLTALKHSVDEGVARLDRLEERHGDHEKATSDLAAAIRRGFERTTVEISRCEPSEEYIELLSEAFSRSEREAR